MEHYLVKNEDGRTLWRGSGPVGCAEIQVMDAGQTIEIVSREAYADDEAAAVKAASSKAERSQ